MALGSCQSSAEGTDTMVELLVSFGRAGVVGALAGLVVNWLVEPTTDGGWWLILAASILVTVVINFIVQATAAAWPRLKRAAGDYPGRFWRLVKSLRRQKTS